MERIQIAIAKARAERAAQESSEASAAMPPEPSPDYRPVEPQTPAPETSLSTPSIERDSTAVAPQDTGLQRTSAEQAWRDLPTLRIDSKKARRNLIVALDNGPEALGFDGIRTRLLQHLKAKNAKRVAIVSPGPDCGKTTVALNLALSLGRQPDQRSILADVDLRRPHMAKALGVRTTHNFADVLSGVTPFADSALRHGPNLALAMTHGPSRNPAELLQSRRAALALDEIQAAYDPTVMLFDLPPLLVNDDSMAFLGQVDCALIIAAAEKTTIKEIDRCERDVASQTSVLGVVLNRCRYMEKADQYRGYYSS
ncbi:CpsD/CapB family tyrosine-protein kinase [Tropicimonas sp. TH_r6]|uniref:CpsD/CapB family tyrosine-protein kinase n=1 Tax=Tropicimonas sp. TH_r6 TaxID=3082085 RepID=UPI002954540F|nr:CpsD/CapB family tyrosine-protein kinase [Tropicimonas sp. TH_r6]MDV7145531.1 CpsD/CapB family tyrosine-protein kinase [Tropicimonas sp. TH_r6]